MMALKKEDRMVTRRKKELARADLEAYAGSYYSAELNVYYTLFLEEGKLKSRIRYRHNEPWHLVHTAKDQFMAEGITFSFTRKGGNVTGVKLDAGRALNIEFRKD